MDVLTGVQGVANNIIGTKGMALCTKHVIQAILRSLRAKYTAAVLVHCRVIEN